MNLIPVTYTFTAKPWQYTGKAAWVFVSLPKNISKEIRAHFKTEEEGWGRLKVTAKTGGSTWATAIWFDTKAGTYLLPVKNEIRKKEAIITGKKVTIGLSL